MCKARRIHNFKIKLRWNYSEPNVMKDTEHIIVPEKLILLKRSVYFLCFWTQYTHYCLLLVSKQKIIYSFFIWVKTKNVTKV